MTKSKKSAKPKNSVKLSVILEGLSMSMDEAVTYLHLPTGELEFVGADDQLLLDSIEDDDQVEQDLAEWEKERLKDLQRLHKNPKEYLELPSNYDRNDWKIMQSFSFAVTDEYKRELLLDALTGKGAFSRFDSLIKKLGIAEQWYAFRDERYKQLTLEWCFENNLVALDDQGKEIANLEALE